MSRPGGRGPLAGVVVAGGLALSGLCGVAPVSAAAPGTGPSPGGQTVFVANLGSDSVTPIDSSTGAAGRAVGLGELPDALAVAPGSKTVYVVEVGSDEDGSPGRVVPLATSGYKLGRAIAVGTDPQAMVITPSGRRAYVLDGTDAATTPLSTPVTVTPIDLVAQKALAPVKVGVLPLSMTMSPNGQLVYVVDSGTDDQGQPVAITPLNTLTGQAGPEIKLPQSSGPFPVSGLAFAPDSAVAYAVTAAGIVPVNTATGTAAKPIGLRTAMPVAIAVTPDGSSIAEVGSPITRLQPGSPYADNYTLALLSTATGAVRRVTTLGDEPGAQAWQVAVSPNGLTAYVLVIDQSPAFSNLVSADSTVIPVNLTTGKAAEPVNVGPGAEKLVISPNGATVYVLVTGPYHASSPHYGAGSVVAIDAATGRVEKAIKVGLQPYALAIAQTPVGQG